MQPLALAEILCAPTTPIAVACSGGPDSVAAAMTVRALHSGSLTLLHFNHHLRGAASDGDEDFVRGLAGKLGADFRVGHWENPNPNANESNARNARLAWLHGWEHEKIIFGHHADDAVETILMRLARGAGIEGLVAPHAVNTVGAHTHIRPLLNLRKSKIVAALESLQIPYRTDATNAGGDYLRNRIRNELLPLWQKIETRDVAAGILAAQNNLRELHRGQKAPPPTAAKKISAAAAYPATTLAAGSSLYIPLGFVEDAPVGVWISARLVPSPSSQELVENSAPASRVWVRPTDSLLVRPWSAGERYTPYGAPGSKKTKELLNATPVSAELPPPLRALWPVVCADDGTPLWLPGCRIHKEATVKKNSATACELRFEIISPTLTPNDT